MWYKEYCLFRSRVYYEQFCQMKSPLYRLLTNVISWFAANFSSRLVAAILFFILTHTSSLAEAGSYSLATTFLAMSIPLMGWGFEHLIIRDVARNREASSEIVGEFLVRRCILAAFAYMLIILAILLIQYPFHTRLIILIACFSLVTDGISELLQAYLVAIEHASINLWAAIPTNLLRLAIGIWVLVSGQGALGLVVVLTVTSFVRCGLLCWVINRRDDLLKSIRMHSFVSYLRKRTWQKQFVNAAPFVVIDVAWIIELQVGIILLSVLLNESAVGVYSSAFAIVSMLLIISYAFMYAIFPVMSRLSDTSKENLYFVYEKACLYMLLIGIIIAIVFSVIAEPLYKILYPSTFLVGATVLKILVWSLVFTFVHAPISRLMLIFNKQRILAIMIGFGAILNIALNLWFIPHLGVMGAAWSRLASYGLFFLLNFWYVNSKVLHIDISRLAIHLLISTFSMLVILIITLPKLQMWSLLPAITTFLVLLIYFRVVNVRDVSKLHVVLIGP